MKMTGNHWTNDAELLERYILHRLEKVEREGLENHLKMCSQCKHVVDEERQLIAGIRHTAREEMKTRLKLRLAAQPTPEMPWIQLATAAAVLVILIGVGIYNDWFTLYNQKELMPEFRMEEPNTVKREERKPSPQQEANKSVREEAATVEQRARHLPKEQRQLREQLQSRKPTPDKSSQPPFEAGEGMRKNESARRTAIERDEMAEDKLKQSGWSTWVDGIILPYPEEQLMTQPEVSASERKALSQQLRDEATKAIPTESQKIVVQQEQRSQVFILRQELITSQLKTKQKPQTIPSFVEATEEGVKITLYVDTPYSKEDLETATIKPVRQDSIVLIVGNQRIGYRIPGVWYESVPAKQ